MHRALLILAAVLAILPVSCVAQEQHDWRTELIVPLDSETEEVSAAKERLVKTLLAVVPPKKGQRVTKTTDGRYVLCGDLFRQGKLCALVELNSDTSPDEHSQSGIGFAVWNGKRWQPRGLWKIEPIWKPEGWKKTPEENFPINPATKPFWTLEVTPDKPPLVIIVGEIWKYWQEHFIARFDPVTESLFLLEETKTAEPVGGYLRLYEDSGHRATFQAYDFRIWNGKKLVQKAYWYDGDETGENPTLKATAYDNDGRKLGNYLIERNLEDDNSYKITRNGRSYANVTIKRSDVRGKDSEFAEVYFFEKLTGLPRKLYPFKEDQPKRLEEVAKITVVGDNEAVKKLSPRAKSGWHFW